MNEISKSSPIVFFPYLAGLFFLIINSPIIFPIIFSSWVVSKFVYLPMLVDAEKENIEWREYLYDKEINQDYSEKFPLLKNLNDNIPPEFTFLCDTTPNGFVFFRYIKDEEGFEYWCDKTVEYKYLETLARKYVNTFNCKQIYHDRKKILEDKRNEIIESKKKKAKIDISDNITDDNDSVFANLKSAKPVTKKIEYVCNVANKYIKRGTLKDYNNIVKQPLKQNIKNDNNNKFFSWASWKKQK